MATPVWTTTAGKIATIDEQVAYSLQLEANTSDSTAIDLLRDSRKPTRRNAGNIHRLTNRYSG